MPLKHGQSHLAFADSAVRWHSLERYERSAVSGGVSGRPMSNEPVQYIPFMKLPLDWAAASGLPPQMALRRLCEWTVAGAFPDGALVTAVGSEVKPLAVFVAFQALANQGAVHIGRWGWHIDPAEALDRLNGIILTKESVLRFCENTNTHPPPSVLSGIRRAWALRNDQKSLAPPACPDAVRCATAQSACDHAIASMNTMRSTLDGLQGKPTRFGPRRVPGEPTNVEYWNAKWAEMRSNVQKELSFADDADLQLRLDSLEAEWTSFIAQEAANNADHATDPQTQQDLVASPSERAPPQRKSRGRPQGSGSYEASDAVLADEMRAAILQEPSLSPTAAAMRLANRAAGAGTPDSKAKRLAERYSAKFGR